MLVKLGGSVITRKSRLCTARPAVIARLAREVSSAKDYIILVHGAGSFGHIKAHKFSLQEGYSTSSQLKAISDVQRDMRRLNLVVIDALISSGMRPVSLPAGVLAKFKDGMMESLDVSPFRRYLQIGMTPVTFGDVVIDGTRQFAICSGDDLMLELSKEFRPVRSIFVTDVDGLYTDDPKSEKKSQMLSEASVEDIRKLDISRRAGSDVTGGIEGKLKKMIESAYFADDCWIINGLKQGRLRDAVLGRKFVGTRVVK